LCQRLINMYIYKIVNLINNKAYIGQTTQKIKYRWKGHLYDCFVKKNKHPIYKTMRKYGIENFKIEEIGGANSLSELNYQEWLLIYKYNTLWPNGYNLREGGSASGKMTPEVCKKNSELRKKYYKVNLQHNAKKVVNIQTGETYNSASECAKKHKVNRTNLINKLLGKTGNNTPFRYVGMEGVCKKPGIGAPKKVVDIKTKKTWNNIRECSKELGINYDILKNKLNGTTVNNTSLRFLHEQHICKQVKQKKQSKKVVDTVSATTYCSAEECANINNININTLRKWLNPKNKIKSRYKYE